MENGFLSLQKGKNITEVYAKTYPQISSGTQLLTLRGALQITKCLPIRVYASLIQPTSLSDIYIYIYIPNTPGHP